MDHLGTRRIPRRPGNTTLPTYYANFISVVWNAPRQPIFWPALGKKADEQMPRAEEFRGGIAQASALIKGATIDRPDLVPLVQGKMFPDMNCVGVWVEIEGNEFAQLLSVVKNRILDFVLQIEPENPNAGEAPPNEDVPDPRGRDPANAGQFAHGTERSCTPQEPSASRMLASAERSASSRAPSVPSMCRQPDRCF